MSARLKLFILVSLLGSAYAVAQGIPYADNVPYSRDGRRFTGDLENKEQVIAYLKAAPKDRREIAEKFFRGTLRNTQRLHSGASWGGIAKSAMENVLLYPTAKAYLLGVEAELRQWSEVRARTPAPDPKLGTALLERSVNRLDVIIAVENYEPTLTDTQRKNLMPYRDCLKRYLDTGKAEANCVPLQWSGDVPVR